MSTHEMSENVLIKQEIKQEIEDQELNVENITEIKSETDIEEHPVFYPKAEPTVFESIVPSIKSEHEQDFDVDVSDEVDPLAVDAWEDAENYKQSEDREKQIDHKNEPEEESIFVKKYLPQSQSSSLTLKKFHECTVCKKTFLKPSLLVRHSRIHTGERPYECCECKKKFTQYSNLVTHSRVHNGEKPYECTVCKMKFSQSASLIKHLRIHTGEKPFECVVCKKKFAQSTELRRHSRIHTRKKY